MNFFIYFLLGFILNLFILYALSPILNKFFITVPVKRSLHFNPIPSGAGISFVLTTLFISILNIFVFKSFTYVHKLIFISSLLGFLGLLDDYIDLSRKFRFGFQFLAILLIIIISPISSFQSIWLIIFSLIGISVVNFINFMDGIDGLIAGSLFIIVFSSSIYFSLSPILISLSGALFLFLFFNWNPAKFFMGDVGSLYLGAIFFGISLNNNIFEMFRIFLLGTPLFFDALSCILRRKYIGENIFKPHKKHIYQRLVQSGISHAKVTLFYIINILFLAIINQFCAFNYLFIASILSILILVLADKKFAIEF